MRLSIDMEIFTSHISLFFLDGVTNPDYLIQFHLIKFPFPSLWILTFGTNPLCQCMIFTRPLATGNFFSYKNTAKHWDTGTIQLGLHLWFEEYKSQEELILMKHVKTTSFLKFNSLPQLAISFWNFSFCNSTFNSETFYTAHCYYRQHCRLSICFHFCWAWQTLNQKQIQITIWWWDEQACLCYYTK